jgi:hypothetical protein
MGNNLNRLRRVFLSAYNWSEDHNGLTAKNVAFGQYMLSLQVLRVHRSLRGKQGWQPIADWHVEANLFCGAELVTTLREKSYHGMDTAIKRTLNRVVWRMDKVAKTEEKWKSWQRSWQPKATQKAKPSRSRIREAAEKLRSKATARTGSKFEASAWIRTSTNPILYVR